jgi:hypothetical protein
MRFRGNLGSPVLMRTSDPLVNSPAISHLFSWPAWDGRRTSEAATASFEAQRQQLLQGESAVWWLHISAVATGTVGLCVAAALGHLKDRSCLCAPFARLFLLQCCVWRLFIRRAGAVKPDSPPTITHKFSRDKLNAGLRCVRAGCFTP